MCSKYLKGDLGCEDYFVSLKEPTAGIHVDGVGDAVDEVFNPLFYIICCFCPINGRVEHHTEGLHMHQHKSHTALKDGLAQQIAKLSHVLY